MNNTPSQAREIVAQALESGEYTQGVGCLERGDDVVTNCCLGVATREFMKCEQHSIIPVRASRSSDIIFGNNVTSLPKEVQTWLGFADRFGKYSGTTLADTNDYLKLPFSEIAELFRHPPEGLLAQ